MSHKIYRGLGFLGMIALPVMLGACGPRNPWIRVRAPTATMPEAIGSYAAGCVRGASALGLTGEGYQVMRPSRRRFYGHPVLIAFIQDLGRKAAGRKLGALLIGDLGQPRGGPTTSTHVSHQTGLEADIWFLQAPPGRILTLEQRETEESPPVVAGDFGGLNRYWTPEKMSILRLAASDPRVDRIFVNPAIKKAACRSHRGEPWLAKLRPWWDHDDHFHARLRCPEQDLLCTNGGEDALPPGDGCDATLEAWFSPEKRAREQHLRKHPKRSGMPVLPAACRDVLKE